MKLTQPRIIFFGSSRYSVIVLESINSIFGVSLSVTLPDKLQGRKKELTPSPVKISATDHNIPIITADKLTDKIISKIENYQPHFFVVADYGLLLPSQLLTIPIIAPLNVHHSLLPKFRGSSPAPAVILAGEKMTGVSIIIMNQKIDAGDILVQKEYTLSKNETSDSLRTILNTKGGELVNQVIKDYDSFFRHRIIQEEKKATFTKHMKKTDGYIRSDSLPNVEQIERMIRAFHPWPGVWTKIRVNGQERIIKFLPEQKIQMEGKKAVSKKDFLNGYPKTKDIIDKIIAS